MKLYIATTNPHKAREIERLLEASGLHARVFSAGEAGGMPPVEEDAPDFTGNAIKKALALRERAPADGWVLADDSGLEVEALGGEPGVRSARYAGDAADDAANRRKLLARLSEAGISNWRARFVCVLALISPERRMEIFEGECRGKIAREEKGDRGFGYDPLFTPDGADLTFAEMLPAEKDSLSHRGMALARLVDRLRSINE